MCPVVAILSLLGQDSEPCLSKAGRFYCHADSLSTDQADSDFGDSTICDRCQPHSTHAGVMAAQGWSWNLGSGGANAAGIGRLACGGYRRCWTGTRWSPKAVSGRRMSTRSLRRRKNRPQYKVVWRPCNHCMQWSILPKIVPRRRLLGAGQVRLTRPARCGAGRLLPGRARGRGSSLPSARRAGRRGPARCRGCAAGDRRAAIPGAAPGRAG